MEWANGAERGLIGEIEALSLSGTAPNRGLSEACSFIQAIVTSLFPYQINTAVVDRCRSRAYACTRLEMALRFHERTRVTIWKHIKCQSGLESFLLVHGLPSPIYAGTSRVGSDRRSRVLSAWQ